MLSGVVEGGTWRSSGRGAEVRRMVLGVNDNGGNGLVRKKRFLERCRSEVHVAWL